VLTRDAAILVLDRVTVAPITTTIRGIRSEVLVGRDEGLSQESAISCDNLLTVPVVALDPDPVGRLDDSIRAQLDRALAYALAIAT